jgi:hypothetical protein
VVESGVREPCEFEYEGGRFRASENEQGGLTLEEWGTCGWGIPAGWIVCRGVGLHAAVDQILAQRDRLREAVELVRAAGCLCAELRLAWKESPGVYDWGGRYADETYLEPGRLRVQLLEHDPRCPVALATAILAKGW